MFITNNGVLGGAARGVPGPGAGGAGHAAGGHLRAAPQVPPHRRRRDGRGGGPRNGPCDDGVQPPQGDKR